MKKQLIGLCIAFSIFGNALSAKDGKNLSTFCNYQIPDSLPSQAKIVGGTVQYVDTNSEGEKKTVIVGPLNVDMLKEVSDFGLPYTIDGYKANVESVTKLKSSLSKYKLLVFMGTWCGDSQEQIPKLLKVLSETSFPPAQLMLWGVDRHKKGLWQMEQHYHIDRVPTIYVLDGELIIGSIVETPKLTIEQDLLAIISDYESKKVIK